MNGIGTFRGGPGNVVHPSVNIKSAPIYVSATSSDNSDYEDSNRVKFENVFKTKVYLGNGSIVNTNGHRIKNERDEDSAAFSSEIAR